MKVEEIDSKFDLYSRDSFNNDFLTCAYHRSRAIFNADGKKLEP